MKKIAGQLNLLMKSKDMKDKLLETLENIDSIYIPQSVKKEMHNQSLVAKV